MSPPPGSGKEEVYMTAFPSSPPPINSSGEDQLGGEGSLFVPRHRWVVLEIIKNVNYIFLLLKNKIFIVETRCSFIVYIYLKCVLLCIALRTLRSFSVFLEILIIISEN